MLSADVAEGSNKERSGREGVDGMPIVAMGSVEGWEAVAGMATTGVGVVAWLSKLWKGKKTAGWERWVEYFGVEMCDVRVDYKTQKVKVC